jgi:hypothetical protein
MSSSLEQDYDDGAADDNRWAEQFSHFELHFEWKKRVGNHFEMPQIRKQKPFD